MSRLLVGLTLSLYTASAAAEVTRYAVVIGNNQGSDGELPLRFAEADARKVSDVLRELGGFPSENLLLLEGQGAAEVQRALISVNARIRSETSAGRDAVLFVYYSGHADALALHLGDEALELSLLQRLVQGSSAGFRVLVLDACRSGALTRVKGGRPIAAFELALQAPLSNEGVAFLTSSAENEDAQESESLQGSFFTHYFVSALRGAADRNQNGAVSLEEAYAFTYQHTLRASSKTLYGTQHPTFRLDLKGRGAIPLTWVSQRGRTGRLALPAEYSFLLFAGSELGPVVAEVGKHDTIRTLALSPGRYFVRGRARDHLVEGVVDVVARRSQEVSIERLQRVEYARLVRKGSDQSLTAHGTWLGYQVQSPLWSDASACHGVRAGYVVDYSAVTFSLALGFCRSGYENTLLRSRADHLSSDLSVSRVIDLPAFSLGFGASLGLGWLHQEFETRGRAPARNSWSLSPGVFAAASLDVGSGWFSFAEALGRASIFRERGQAGNEHTTAVPGVQFTLGAGKRIF